MLLQGLYRLPYAPAPGKFNRGHLGQELLDNAPFDALLVGQRIDQVVL